MNNAHVAVPPPRNEPVLNYTAGSSEKRELKSQLREFASDRLTFR